MESTVNKGSRKEGRHELDTVSVSQLHNNLPATKITVISDLIPAESEPLN